MHTAIADTVGDVRMHNAIADTVGEYIYHETKKLQN